MGFCVTAYRLGREAAYDTLVAKFTDEQWSLLRDIIDEAEIASTRGPRSPVRIEDDTSSESSKDSEDSSEESDAGEPQEGPDVTPLDQAVFRLIVASVKQEVGGAIYESPLMCFLAAAGIRKAPLGYIEPYLYTGLLAGVL